MNAEKQPYELLVRWDENGALKGAHVQWRYIVRDESGAIVSESVTPSEAVDIGAGKGFPLADILNTAQADALTKVEALRKERDEARDQAMTAQGKIEEILAAEMTGTP
jgi:16S rRNA G527 N7-methylase RsmG